MRIASFQITNYKSVLATREIALADGFNVIVGQNNVGKTALVEALSLHFTNKPHRSLSTSPRRTVAIDPISRVEIKFEISRVELTDLLGNRVRSFFAPVPEQVPGTHAEYFIEAYGRADIHVLRAVYDGDGNVLMARFETFGAPLNTMIAVQFEMVPGDPIPRATGSDYNSVDPGSQVAGSVARELKTLVYAFKAERLNVGESIYGHEAILTPHAQNLAEVLNHLQGNNPPRFQQLNALVSTVLDDVRLVTAVPFPGGFQIRVWTVDPDLQREDLAVPLAESGTGVGQVLAILYVALTSEYPRTIIIDEPQSFLHPGAVRKLIDVLRDESLLPHQYVITTHSPTVIAAAMPRVLLAARKEDMTSRIDPIDVAEAESVQRFLDEIGTTLIDVFGADDILWVEGPTEVRCFPLIFSDLIGRPLLGTLIRGVRHTGDFDRYEAKAAFEIYNRLRSPRGLVPPAIGFIFDREGRTDVQRSDLARQGHGHVHFLNRRMYENYLLNSHAIAYVAAASIEDVVAEPVKAVTLDRVFGWLQEHRWETRFFDRLVPEEERTESHWVREVHGSKLLASCFGDLSAHQIEYHKVDHGEALTRWLLQHAPEELREVATLIDRALIATSARQ